MTPDHGYLIHKDGRGYYCAGAKGYTLNADNAGRFSLKDAIAYSHPNGPSGPRDGITYQHEGSIPSGKSCESDLIIHRLMQERDDLRAGQEIASQELSEALQRIATLEAEKRGTESALDFMSKLSA